MQLETAPVTGSRVERRPSWPRVMNNDFSVFPNASFPVYTLSTDSGPRSACQGLCALFWQPVLTSARADAGAGVDQHAVGIIVRPDGTHQVTYNDKPLYLFVGDAYIAGLPVGIAGRPASTERARTPHSASSTRSRRRPSGPTGTRRTP